MEILQRITMSPHAKTSSQWSSSHCADASDDRGTVGLNRVTTFHPHIKENVFLRLKLSTHIKTLTCCTGMSTHFEC